MNRPGTRRATFAYLVVMALVTSVAACGSSDTSESGDSLEFEIGVLVPLTGDLSAYGPSMQHASDLALEQIESAIEDTGADQVVTLESADSQGEPQAAVQAARSLVAGGAGCLAGPASSAETLPVARSVAIRDRVPLISSVATSEELGELDHHGLVARVMITDRFQGQALVDAMEEYDFEGSAEGRVANVVARNDAYGTGVVEYFRQAFEAAGGTIGTEVLYDPEQPSFDSEAAKVTEDDADVFLIVAFPGEFVRLGPALKRTGKWTPADSWGISLLSDSLPDEAGPEVTEGLSDAGQGTPKDSAMYQSFTDLYRDSDGPPAQAFDAHQFDAVMLCYLAAAAAGSTDPDAMAEELPAVSGPPGEKFGWNELPAALEALQNGEQIDYEGASGPIDLDDRGDPTKGVFEIFTILDGKYVSRGQVMVSGSE